MDPIIIHYTPDSPLSGHTGHKPRFIGSRSRLATCGGVAWFHKTHIATVNLAGNALHTYRFESHDNTLVPVQLLTDRGPGERRPENLAFSPDGRLLAITNTRDGAVCLYAVDRNTHRVTPEPLTTIQHAGDINTHGVSFSPCSGFLAYTIVNRPGKVRLCRVCRDASGGVGVTMVQELPNHHGVLRAKGIDFSRNGRFVAICHAPNAGPKKSRKRGSLLCIHMFRGDQGIDPHPISSSGSALEMDGPDDVRFFPDGSHLVVTNQMNDTAIIVRVNEETGMLGTQRMILTHARSKLNFPHGCGFSEDGRHLAIANYGDDTLTIYETHPDVNVASDN